MHFSKILNYFTIWLVIFGIFETEVALYSIDKRLYMPYSKTMKSIVFLDTPIVIFLWQCKLVNTNLVL